MERRNSRRWVEVRSDDHLDSEHETQQESPGKGKAWRMLVAPVIGMMIGLGIMGIGIVGLVLRTSPDDLPNLFLGVLSAGILLFLLIIPTLSKRVMKGHRRRGRKFVEANDLAKKVWALPVEKVCADLGVSARLGLTDGEAESRYKIYGANEIVIHNEPGYFGFFVKEIFQPAQVLLACVGVLYLSLRALKEAITAFVVIFLMASAKVGTEWRAKLALSRLGHSSPFEVFVTREGQHLKLDPRCLVPGDIVNLRVEMEVPADIRLIRSYFLCLDESKLTGESRVLKDPTLVLSEDTSELERANVALAGSIVRQGRAVGVVYRTGTSTYLGQVLCTARKRREKETPLQKVIRELSCGLIIVASLLSIFGALLGLLRKMKWQDVIISGLSLAFATIPQELSILIVAVLAVGAQTLSSRLMYVKKLRAVEKLGFIDTIMTDKTGTLTENRMLWHSAYLGTVQYAIRSRALSYVRSFDSGGLQKLFEAWLFMSDLGDDLEDIRYTPQCSGQEDQGQSCNDFARPPTSYAGHTEMEDLEPSSPHHVDGDMFDRAVLFALGSSVCFLGGSPGYGFLASNPEMKAHLENAYKIKMDADFIAEIPFDPRVKFASRTFHLDPVLLKHGTSNSAESNAGKQVVYIKGAPEILLSHCSYALENGDVVPMNTVKKDICEHVSKVASKGCRLIAYAYQEIRMGSSSAPDKNKLGKPAPPYSVLEDAIYLGFLSFIDPVREEATLAVQQCQAAGVRVIMVTGDHLETAINVAQEVGIISAEKEEDPRDMALSCRDIHLPTLEKDRLEDLVTRIRVFGRANPTDKFVILETLQRCAKSVMAIGDGFHDLPILAKADVGLALGKSTDVAREAASMVVMDDNFNMIPFSLTEGRRLLDNLRKALAFYLGAKLGFILLFISGTLCHRYPLSALQIIFLELFMELGACTTFVMEPSDDDLMKRRPRHPSQKFFDVELLGGVFVAGISMSATVLTSFLYAVYHNRESAQTSAFFTWLFVQVLMALNLRTLREPVVFKGVFSNIGVTIWFVATAGLTILLCTSSFLQKHLALVPLSKSHWLHIILMSLTGTCWIELTKFLLLRRGSSNPDKTMTKKSEDSDIEVSESLLVVGNRDSGKRLHFSEIKMGTATIVN